MVTGESKPVAKGPGDRVVAGTVATDSAIRIKVEAVGDGHRTGRDPAAGGPGSGVTVPRPGAGRPGRRAPLLRGGGRCRGDRRRLAARRESRRGGGADRVGAGDRLPPCPGTGHPVGDLHLHRARRPQRDPGQGPSRPRADADRRPGAVRQDRHADQGEPPGHRCRMPSTATRTGLLALAAAVESDSEHPLARAIVAAAPRVRFPPPPGSVR